MNPQTTTDPLALLLSMLYVSRDTATRHRLTVARMLLRDALGVLLQAEYRCTRDVAVTLVAKAGGEV